MICTLDACVLVLWASTKTDETMLARLDHLLETVAKADGVLVIPTPAVSELLVRAGEGTDSWLSALQKRSVIRIAPFDLKAAAECAEIHLEAVAAGGKRHGTKKGEPYQKIKVDRQIAAIARVAGADLLITDDEGLLKVAQSVGLPAIRPAELDLPASARQAKLDFKVKPPDSPAVDTPERSATFHAGVSSEAPTLPDSPAA